MANSTFEISARTVSAATVEEDQLEAGRQVGPVLKAMVTLSAWLDDILGLECVEDGANLSAIEAECSTSSWSA